MWHIWVIIQVHDNDQRWLSSGEYQVWHIWVIIQVYVHDSGQRWLSSELKVYIHRDRDKFKVLKFVSMKYRIEVGVLGEVDGVMFTVMLEFDTKKLVELGNLHMHRKHGLQDCLSRSPMRLRYQLCKEK